MKNIGEFWSLPKGIAERSELTMAEKLVFSVFWTRRNGENISWPSHQSVADSLSLSRRQVIRIVESLEKMGLITIKRNVGRNKTNEYTINDEMVTSMSPIKKVTSTTIKGDISGKKKVTLMSHKENSEENSEENIITPSQEMQHFITSMEMGDVSEDGCGPILNVLLQRGFSRETAIRELMKFYAYWTERTGSGKKQRWQLEKTFELKRRLTTWFSNSKKFSRQPEAKGVRI